MDPQPTDDRLAQLESDNVRLRALLGTRGAPAELRHQVRNMLALVRSVLRLSTAGSRSVEDYAAKTEGRLDALLRVQTMLIAAPGAGVELHRLVADELTAHAIRVGESAELSGPEVRLDPKAAEVFGLALHELTLNAIEHGAMNSPSGRLAVAWSLRAEPPTLVLEWRETGATRPNPAPTRGFGLETVENMLAYQLCAETKLELRPDGLKCVIALPFQCGPKRTVIV